MTQPQKKLGEQFVTWSRAAALIAPFLLALFAWFGSTLYNNVAAKLEELSVSNQLILSRQLDFAIDIVELQTQMLERTSDRYTATAAEADLHNIQIQIDQLRLDVDNILQGNLP